MTSFYAVHSQKPIFFIERSCRMKKIFTNSIFVLLIIAILLPMLFLLTVVIGEVAATVSEVPEKHGFFVQFSCFLAAFWFFDLVLLLIALAMKELASHGIFDKTEDQSDELLEEEYDRFVSKE